MASALRTGRRESAEVEVKFRRDLGLLEITMIGLGPTIGTTIFLLVGPGLLMAGPALLLVFVLNFGVTVFTAMAYIELGSAFPETGGGYLWVKTALRGPYGFIGGWISWFGHCIVGAFYTVSFGYFAVYFLTQPGYPLASLSAGDQSLVIKGLSLIVLAVFIGVNYRGAKATGRSSIAITLVLLGIVITYVVAGLVWFAQHPASASNLTPLFQSALPYPPAVVVMMAMGLTFIVFEGYEIIAQTGEETRNPERDIPRANFLTLGIATLIFVAVAFVTIVVLGTGDPLLLNQASLAVAAQKTFPTQFLGLLVITAGVLIGSLAALPSLIFSSSRVAFAMGRDGDMPRLFARLHKDYRTPKNAILVSGLIIGLMIVFLDVIQIAASADLMFLILFTLVNGAVIVLRRTHPDVKRPWRMPLFPLLPIIGLGSKAVLSVALYLVEPLAWLVGLGWTVLGFGVYYLWTRRERIAEAAAPIMEAFIPVPRERYHVLVPVQELENRALIDFASLIARVEDGDVTVLNVIEVPTTLPLNAIERGYISEVRRGLGGLARIASDAGVRSKGRAVVSHQVAEAVLETVRDEEVNLLVVGWKGTSRRGLVLATNVDRFVQEAPCDVVVFKTAGLPERLARILVMNAPEWHVSYATGYAILLAKQHRAAVTVFSAAQTDAEL
ncbi:MAG TPA: amino acid permease, partial [Thermoplasmata archaeon]|nr:amino acid permease [Thermoplasmata archaeon]